MINVKIFFLWHSLQDNKLWFLFSELLILIYTSIPPFYLINNYFLYTIPGNMTRMLLTRVHNTCISGEGVYVATRVTECCVIAAVYLLYQSQTLLMLDKLCFTFPPSSQSHTSWIGFLYLSPSTNERPAALTYLERNSRNAAVVLAPVATPSN